MSKFLLVLFIVLLHAFPAVGNSCFETFIKQALVLEERMASNKAIFEENPFKDLDATRTWLQHVNENNIYDAKTLEKLKSIKGILAPETRRSVLQASLEGSPYFLNKQDAQALTNQLVEAYARMEAPTKLTWQNGRFHDHILGVSYNPGVWKLSGGGHTIEGFEKFVEKVYNPRYPAQATSFQRLNKAPTEADFKTGKLLIETLPNGIQRLYVPGSVMTTQGANSVKKAASMGNGFFREAIPGQAEAYASKTLFPKGWGEKEILEAQSHVLKNPQSVKIGINNEGKVSLFRYEGSYTYQGKTIKLHLVGSEVDGNFQITTIYPFWNQ